MHSEGIAWLDSCFSAQEIPPQSLWICQMSHSAGANKWGLPLSLFSVSSVVLPRRVWVGNSPATVDAIRVQIIQAMFVFCMACVRSRRNWECLTHVLPAIRKSSLDQKQGNFSDLRSDHVFATDYKPMLFTGSILSGLVTWLQIKC